MNPSLPQSQTGQPVQIGRTFIVQGGIDTRVPFNKPANDNRASIPKALRMFASKHASWLLPLFALLVILQAIYA